MIPKLSSVFIIKKILAVEGEKMNLFNHFLFSSGENKEYILGNKSILWLTWERVEKLPLFSSQKLKYTWANMGDAGIFIHQMHSWLLLLLFF